MESACFCGVCDQCRNNRADLCDKGPSPWGGPTMGFSDYMVVPTKCLVAYDGLSPDVACLTEPAGVAFDLVRVADIRLGDRLCLVGPGPVGLMALAMALHQGAMDVVCIGLPHDAKRLALAEELGAQTIVHAGSLDELPDLQRRFNHVLVTAPTKVIPQALSLLAKEGRLTFLGLAHGDRMITFDAEDFHFRKLQLRASFASPAMLFPVVLRLMTAGVIPAGKLISHRFALADIVQELSTYRDDKVNLVKAVASP